MSSEAAERRASIHELCIAWMSVPSLPDNAIPASPDDVLWLLAEVARLEQDARERDAAFTEVEASAARSLADLAAARAREQRLAEALEKIARSGPVFDAKGTWSKRVCDDARAALAEQPAADERAAVVWSEPRQQYLGGPVYRDGLATGTSPGSASAAADEPGEQPAADEVAQ